MIILNGTLAFLALVSTTLVQAQDNLSPDLPVTIVGNKWRAEIRNPKIDEDPFKAVKEHDEAERERIATNRRNEILIERGLPTVNPPVRPIKPDTGPRGLIATYIYELKVRNTGKKSISKLIWEYVFFEPGTEREVGRRRFESKINIGPGKTKTLKIRSTSSPTGILDATKSDNNSREQYVEKIVIRSVEYADGSLRGDG